MPARDRQPGCVDRLWAQRAHPRPATRRAARRGECPAPAAGSVREKRRPDRLATGTGRRSARRPVRGVPCGPARWARWHHWYRSVRSDHTGRSDRHAVRSGHGPATRPPVCPAAASHPARRLPGCPPSRRSGTAPAGCRRAVRCWAPPGIVAG